MAEFPFRDLRGWLEFCEEQNDLVRVTTEVNINQEIAAISRRNTGEEGPVLLFENLKGFPGWKLAADLLTTRKRLAWAAGVKDPANLEKELAPRWDMHVPPMLVETGPCKEIKITGDDIDLVKIPACVTGGYESCPNLAAAIYTSKDPTIGWQNVSMRRLCVKNPKYGTEFLTRLQQDAFTYGVWREMGQPQPIAFVMGVDPLMEMVTQSKQPIGFCEYDTWGAVTGVPLEVVKCETSDLLIPAHAELVIEAELPVHDRELDVSYPEAWGYNTGNSIQPRVNITCITMRSDPIYRHITAGWVPAENHIMSGPVYATGVLRGLWSDFGPAVLDVKAFHMGFTLVIQVDKRFAKTFAGFASHVAHLVFYKYGTYTFQIFIVDQDITDITNLEEVTYAFVHKCNYHKDVYIWGPNMGAGRLNPKEDAGYGSGICSRMVIDAVEPDPPYDEGYKKGKAYPAARWLDYVEQEENWAKYGIKRRA